MDIAWGLAKKWTIRLVEDNLFILQVSCLGDWNCVMNEGPWIFRQQGVMLEKYDGIEDPKSVALNRIHAWVQVRGIPPLFHKDELVRDMAARIGEVLSVDLYALGASGTSFMRVRVKLNVQKPLTRVVGLHPEGNEKMMFLVLYEKLLHFCEVCGLLSHGDLECGDGVHDQEAKQYGTWMVAPAEDWHPQTAGIQTWAPPRDQNSGSGGGGRGRGRGVDSRKHPPGESPPYTGRGKTGGGKGEATLLITDGPMAMEDQVGARKNLGQALEVEAKNIPGSPVKSDPKRPRRSDTNPDEAGSGVEHRQEQ
jgi:hypothetical protein